MISIAYCLLGAAADFQSERGSSWNILKIPSTCINPGPECSSLPDAALKELVNDSLPETGPLSGSSNSGSERADLSVSDKELAKSMISFLLPRAVPLLEKTYVRRKSGYGSQAVRLGATSTLSKASSAEHMAKNDRSSEKIYEGMLNSSSTNWLMKALFAILFSVLQTVFCVWLIPPLYQITFIFGKLCFSLFRRAGC